MDCFKIKFTDIIPDAIRFESAKIIINFYNSILNQFSPTIQYALSLLIITTPLNRNSISEMMQSCIFLSECNDLTDPAINGINQILLLENTRISEILIAIRVGEYSELIEHQFTPLSFEKCEKKDIKFLFELGKTMTDRQILELLLENLKKIDVSKIKKYDPNKTTI